MDDQIKGLLKELSIQWANLVSQKNILSLMRSHDGQKQLDISDLDDYLEKSQELLSQSCLTLNELMDHLKNLEDK